MTQKTIIMKRDPSKPRVARPKKFRFKLASFQRELVLVVNPDGVLELRELGLRQAYTITVGGLFLNLVKTDVELGIAKKRRINRRPSSLAG